MTEYIGPRGSTGSTGSGQTRGSSGDNPYGSPNPPAPRGVPRAFPVFPGRGPLPGGNGTPTPNTLKETFSDQGRIGGAVKGPDVLPLIYGTQLVQGRQVGYSHSGSWNRAFVVIGAGEIDSVLAIYDGSSLAPSNSFYFYDVYTGATNQTGDTTLNGWYYPYHNARFHDPLSFPGVAYIHASAYQWSDFTGNVYQVERLLPSDWKLLVKGIKVRTSFASETRSYSENPAWIIRDVLTSESGANLPDSIIDQATFSEAASVCAETVDGSPRYTLNVVLASQQNADSYIEALRGHFAGDVYFEDGKIKLWVDGPRTASGITFDTTNSRDFSLYEISTLDKPTKVTIEYPDASKLYAYAEITAELPVSNAATDVREARYTMEGITSGSQAKRIANYILRAANYSKLQAQFIASPLAASVSRGMVVSVTSSIGLTGQLMTVTGKTRLDNGEFTIIAKEYDASVYSSDPLITDTPLTADPVLSKPTVVSSPEFSDPDFLSVVPSYAGFTALGKFFWTMPRNYASVDISSSQWTNSGFPTFSASAIGDGLYSTVAFNDRFTAAATLTVDLGQALPIGALSFVTDAGYSVTWGPIGYELQYSDDGVSFSGLPSAPDTEMFIISEDVIESGTRSRTVYELPDVGSHQYWRLKKNLRGSAGITDVFELRLMAFEYIEAITHYEVYNASITPASLLITIPRGSEPTKDNPLNLPQTINAYPSHDVHVYAVTGTVKSLNYARIWTTAYDYGAYSDFLIAQPSSASTGQQAVKIGVVEVSADALTGKARAKQYFLAGS